MSMLVFTPRRSRDRVATLRPAAMRCLFLGLVGVAATAGLLATASGAQEAAVASAGADLTRLLRLMMLLKAAMAAAVAAVLWRLGWPVSPGWFGAYALAGAVMVAGPGLIWSMAHVGLGALLLHGGLAATVVLLWRDPMVASALGEIVKRRAARRRESTRRSRVEAPS